MLGVIAIPAVILFIGVLFLPNSPRWLAAHGRFNEAQRVLDRLRNSSEQAREELEEIRESLQVKQRGWSLFRSNGNFRRAVWLGMLLQVMQQFTGMNVVMYYAPKIFNIAGFSSTSEQTPHLLAGAGEAGDVEDFRRVIHHHIHAGKLLHNL